MTFLKTLTFGIAFWSSVQAAAVQRKRALSFDYGNTKVRGVNLGGWFVLEPWITPSLFQAAPGTVDEYTYTQSLGQAEASSRLTQHWSTWITQADFQEIAADGLNHVRIPVGYWAVNPLDGDPYVQGQLPYLDQAIVWARQAGLKVLLDLHGAPLSQNGFDNSGKYGVIDWSQGSSTSQTIQAVRNLAFRYVNDLDVVTSIEVLNEPLGPALDMNVVKQFYRDAWGNVRDSNPDTAVVMHDAFQDITEYWNGFATDLSHTILDTHNYQVFSNGELSRSPSQHIQTACDFGRKLQGTDKWTIVGEWAGAQTDCALWLNGRDQGARYDGTFTRMTDAPVHYGDCTGKSTGTVDGLSATDKTNIRQYIEAQLDAFEQGAGWIFWTWKNEGAPEWHFQELARAGIMPQPLTERQYPNQCGF